MTVPSGRGEEWFSELVDLLPVLAWECDASGQPLWVNAETARYLGIARDRPRSLAGANVVHPEDLRGMRATFQAAARDRRPFRRQCRVRRADGAMRWLETWAAPRIDPDGEYVGHVGVSVDVTEHHAAESALQSIAAAESYRARLLAALRAATDPVEVQARAAEMLGRELGASRVHYAEVDPGQRFGVVHADYHPGGASVVGVHWFDRYGPLVMDKFRAGQITAVPDVATDERLSAAERGATLALGRVGAYLLVPLVKDGRSVALLVVHHPGPHDYVEHEIALVETTAELTWSAVERSRAEHALRVSRARAELVTELLSQLERLPSLGDRVQRLAELLVPSLADHAVVEVPRRRQRLLGIAPRDADESGSVRERPGAQLTVPLDLGGGIRGALTVTLTDPARPPYTDEDRAFLEAAAERVGSMLAAARLRQEEHAVSVRLQQALLPDELRWDPNVLIEARYHAASELLEVGGDWYDTFAWPDGQIGVMVGDVVGHNLDSAAAMGRLRAATAALATRTRANPAALLDALERFAAGPDGADFATAVCAVVDPGSGRLTYASAGHPPGVVMPPGGPLVRLEEGASLPLCGLAVGAREELTLTLEPGSLVVLYSDGLVERRGRSLEAGLARLEEVVAQVAGEPLDVVADRIVTELTAESPPDDDVVVACLRYTPVTARFAATVGPGEEDFEDLGGLRVELDTWLGAVGVPERVGHHAGLAVTLACTGVLERDGAGRTGRVGGTGATGAGDGAGVSIDVEVAHHGDHLTVQVRDYGSGRTTARVTADDARYVEVLEALADRIAWRRSPGGSTLVLTLTIA